MPAPYLNRSTNRGDMRQRRGTLNGSRSACDSSGAAFAHSQHWKAGQSSSEAPTWRSGRGMLEVRRRSTLRRHYTDDLRPRSGRSRPLRDRPKADVCSRVIGSNCETSDTSVIDAAPQFLLGDPEPRPTPLIALCLLPELARLWIYRVHSKQPGFKLFQPIRRVHTPALRRNTDAGARD